MSGLNIADVFETVVATVPDHPALIVRTSDGHDELRLTFGELDARVNTGAAVRSFPGW
jgi:acyl-CoA synthetase (AMP-forming)/AMP-acid ligase II